MNVPAHAIITDEGFEKPFNEHKFFEWGVAMYFYRISDPNVLPPVIVMVREPISPMQVLAIKHGLVDEEGGEVDTNDITGIVMRPMLEQLLFPDGNIPDEWVEYADEAENQEGAKYWTNFPGGVEEVREDFKLYLSLID